MLYNWAAQREMIRIAALGSVYDLCSNYKKLEALDPENKLLSYMEVGIDKRKMEELEDDEEIKERFKTNFSFSFNQDLLDEFDRKYEPLENTLESLFFGVPDSLKPYARDIKREIKKLEKRRFSKNM